MSRRVGIWDRHSGMSEGDRVLTYGLTIHSFCGGHYLSGLFCNKTRAESVDLLINGALDRSAARLPRSS